MITHKKLIAVDVALGVTLVPEVFFQLSNKAEYDMKNSADQGGCYSPKPKAEVDNTL